MSEKPSAYEIGKSLRDLLIRFGTILKPFINQQKGKGNNTITAAQLVAPYRARINSIIDGSFVPMPQPLDQPSKTTEIEIDHDSYVN